MDRLKSMGPLSILRQERARDGTNPRDKIFGFLGLLQRHLPLVEVLQPMKRMLKRSLFASPAAKLQMVTHWMYFDMQAYTWSSSKKLTPRLLGS
jgi:hypothetical protein